MVSSRPTQFSGALKGGTPVAEQALVPEAQPSRLAPEDGNPSAAPQGVPELCVRRKTEEAGGLRPWARARVRARARPAGNHRLGKLHGVSPSFASCCLSPLGRCREHLGPSLTHWPWTAGGSGPVPLPGTLQAPGDTAHCLQVPLAGLGLGGGWPRASISVQELGALGLLSTFLVYSSSVVCHLEAEVHIHMLVRRSRPQQRCPGLAAPTVPGVATACLASRTEDTAGTAVTAAPPASCWWRSPGTFHINKSAVCTITFPRRMNE